MELTVSAEECAKWMYALGFISFSTIFQSYLDDGWVIMKGCVQMEPRLRLERFPAPQVGLEPRPLDQ